MKNPEIRFIDDNIDWQTKQLKEVSVPLKSGTLTQDKLSPDGKYPVVNGGVSYYGYYDNYNNENAFTISARGENAGFCRFNKDKFWAGGLCYPYRGKGAFDTHFISILLNKYEKEIKENYVIRTSIPAVNKSDIEHFNIKFPSISVQKEISSLLSDIDQKINNQEILVQKLKDTKSALLIKMFPQENQSVPELRFDGFTNDWEQRKLGNCFDERIERSANGELIAVTINSGVVKASELNRHDTSSKDKSNYKVVKINDIAYNSMRMWQGASGFSKYNGILSPAYTVVIPKENIDSIFFAYLFKKTDIIEKFKLNSQGLTSDTWNLKFPKFSTILIKVPKIEEQQKISSLFTNLDNLITLHQCKSYNLKNL